MGKRYLITLIFSVTTLLTFGQEKGKPLPAWKEGMLDLHHINTGRGNAAFYIFPDGTTMLLDAGELDPTDPRTTSARNSAIHPDNSKQPYEWIASYIQRMSPDQEKNKLNYALITHFHDDHFGSVYKGVKHSLNSKYALTGITGVGDLIPIDVLIDRGYPDYNNPWDMKMLKQQVKDVGDSLYVATMQNYWNFIKYQEKFNSMKVQQLKAGSDDQIIMKINPKDYPDFRVRNIKANGMIWTGTGNTSFDYFANVPKEKIPENPLSLAIRIDYGNFRYYTGGDNPGIADLGSPSWMDTETPMAKAIGEVDVATMDHHGNRDSHNEYNISTLKPRVWIEQTWSSDHPGQEVLRRVTSKYLYPEERDLFATNILEANKLVIGPGLENSYKSIEGHILVRVMPGAKEYYVIILNDENTTLEIKEVFGPYRVKMIN